MSESVNRWVPELRRRGVEAIVVLAHSGAFQKRGDAGRARGEIIDETRQMSDAVDVVVAGHTHSQLNTTVANREGSGHKLLVQAHSYGEAYDRVMLRVDRRSGTVVRKTADVPRTWSDEVSPHARLAAHVAHYARRVAPLADQVVGVARRPLTRTSDGGRTDSALGTLMADAERRRGRADFALVNPGSMRSDIPAGPVTYAELFSVASYEHPLMRLELTGAQLRAALEEQWKGGHRTMLQVSGLRYRYDASRRAGRRIVGLARSNGRPVRARARYSVVANELIATGRAFAVLRRHGRRARVIGSDLDALAAHVELLGARVAPARAARAIALR